MQIDGFEWDQHKAALNERKYDITFEEAVSVFYDENALLIPDPEHSFGEERYLLFGLSVRTNLLVVVHCERENNIRIISARTATKKEAFQYHRRH